jgi:glucose-6-phosphate 1-dehydrogenase
MENPIDDPAASQILSAANPMANPMTNPVPNPMTGPEMNINTSPCEISEPLDPFTIVIFGATGDLTARKLIPALFNLYINHGLPERFTIVGCGRTRLTDGQFQNRLTEIPTASDQAAKDQWRSFATHLHYCAVDYDDQSSYGRLADTLDALNKQVDTGKNHLFYLALPPTLYQPVARQIGKAGLSKEHSDGNGWSRLVVEKPFGRDLETAVRLNQGIRGYFKEHQVFRIDHYLAKETVQNVLMFRFANAIFEPVWNRQYIDYVTIQATETLGVEHRAGYYEQAGVLRDMFQNHMMQLLALIAMESPSRFMAEQVRDERVKVFRSLRPFAAKTVTDHLVLGQYGPGRINKKNVRAYRHEPGVDPDSLTPTFARITTFIDNWRWQGVPFYLTSGKRLARKVTEISIQFKDVPYSMFRRVLGERIAANRLILGIYPDEKIALTFQTKQPGSKVCLRPVTMNFDYQQDGSGPILDAYEKVLMDCILGDHMLFWRQDGIERCWAYLTPLMAACESCEDRGRKLRFYESGTWGPVKKI